MWCVDIQGPQRVDPLTFPQSHHSLIMFLNKNSQLLDGLGQLGVWKFMVPRWWKRTIFCFMPLVSQDYTKTRKTRKTTSSPNLSECVIISPPSFTCRFLLETSSPEVMIHNDGLLCINTGLETFLPCLLQPSNTQIMWRTVCTSLHVRPWLSHKSHWKHAAVYVMRSGCKTHKNTFHTCVLRPCEWWGMNVWVVLRYLTANCCFISPSLQGTELTKAKL